MRGERFERVLGHGVNGERSGEGFDVENVGSGGIFRASAGPEQPLRKRTRVVNPLPARRTQQRPARFVCAAGNGNSQLVAQSFRNFFGNGRVPAAHKNRGHGAHAWIEPSFNSPLDAPDEGFRSGEIVFPVEQQRDVHGNARENALLNGREACRCPGNLDEQIWTCGTRMKLLCRRQRAFRVIRQQW